MNGWLVAGAFALAAVSAVVGYQSGYADARTAGTVSALETKTADQSFVIEKQAEYRQEEVRRADVVETVSRGTDASVAAAIVSNLNSDLVAQRLQKQLDAAERKFSGSVATCDARIAEQGKTATENYRMLADLYRESDTAAGIRAKEAEDYRIAGEACEAIYDGVRNSPR